MLPTDPLAPPEKTVSPADIVRFVLGVLLLLLGLSLGGWVVGYIVQLLDNPRQLLHFQELLLPLEENPEFVLLPRELWIYVVPIALLSTVGAFASTLLQSGTTLLSGNFEQLQRTVTQKLDDLQAQVQKVVNQLNLPRS